MILNKEDGDGSLLQNLLFQQMKALMLQTPKQHPNPTDSPSLQCNLQSIQYQNYILNQYQMIAKQNQFLQQIKHQIAKKKSSPNHQILFCGNTQGSIDILPMQSSFDMSNISGLQTYDDEPFKTKFGQEFEKSLLASALNQVQQNCSNSTYEAIRNCVLNSKQKQYDSVSQKYQKATKRLQQLQTTFIIKSTQLAQAESQLKQAMVKIQNMDQQKKKLKFKANLLSQKQKRIYKLQSSIVFKEKLFHQGKKRYQREKALFLSIQQQLNQLYLKMQNIWEEITDKMNQAQQMSCITLCEQNTPNTSCWKKQVMRKCKQQLIDQRNLLREEQEEIQKEFEMIQSLSEQVKNFLNEKQLNPTVDPFTSQQSSIIFDPK